MSNVETIIPKVGMGATEVHYSDREPMTIIEVTGKTVTVQRDDAKRIDSNGMSDQQDYEYTPNPNGIVRKYSLRKNGEYVLVGDKQDGMRIVIGSRRKYHDYSF